MAASRAEGEEPRRGGRAGGEEPRRVGRGEEAAPRGVRTGGEEPRRRRRSRSMQRRRRCRGMQRRAWPDSRDDSRDVTFSFACYATTLQIKYCSKHNHMHSSGVVVSIFPSLAAGRGIDSQALRPRRIFFILLACAAADLARKWAPLSRPRVR